MIPNIDKPDEEEAPSKILSPAVHQFQFPYSRISKLETRNVNEESLISSHYAEYWQLPCEEPREPLILSKNKVDMVPVQASEIPI